MAKFTPTPDLVPVRELVNHPNNEHATWDVPLPDAVTRSLGGHVPTLNGLSTLATLGRVSFVAGEVGKRDEDDGLVFGNSGGSGAAVAALASSFHLPNFRRFGAATLSPRPDHPFAHDAVIRLDVDAMGRKVSAAGELHNPEAWTKLVKRGALQGLGQAILANTLVRDQRDLLFTVAQAYGLCMEASTSIVHLTGNLQPLHLVSGAAIFSKILDHSLRERGYDLSFKEIPWSILPFSVDRLLVTAGYALFRHKPIRSL